MAGSATVASLFAQRVTVGVGDMAVSNNAQIVVSTYALGSCVGIVAYAPAIKTGGILHIMLPEAKISPGKASGQPAMFADTGLPYFFSELAGFGAQAGSLNIFVAGGASVMGGTDMFKIGERNQVATLAYLSSHGLRVKAQDFGGTINRTVHLELRTGTVSMKTPLGQSQYSLL